MATTTSPARPTAGSTRGPRLQRWFSANLIRIYAVLAFAYIFVPVAYTFVFSFNDSGKSNLELAAGSPPRSGPTRAVPRTSALPWPTASRSGCWPRWWRRSSGR